MKCFGGQGSWLSERWLEGSLPARQTDRQKRDWLSYACQHKFAQGPFCAQAVWYRAWGVSDRSQGGPTSQGVGDFTQSPESLPQRHSGGKSFHAGPTGSVIHVRATALSARPSLHLCWGWGAPAAKALHGLVSVETHRASEGDVSGTRGYRRRTSSGPLPLLTPIEASSWRRCGISLGSLSSLPSPFLSYGMWPYPGRILCCN